jgi:phage regulator Rha-like protein
MVSKSLLPLELIEKRIYLIRNQKVMMDTHLAELYGVETKNLNKAVSRNLERFPDDFMFQISKEEWDSLKFQFGTSKKGRGGRRYLPYAFTEQGVAMLSSVLKSKRAVQVNIQIMRAFVKLREILSTHKELAQKLKELELKIDSHDQQIQSIFEAIIQLITTPNPPKRKMGFTIDEYYEPQNFG